MTHKIIRFERRIATSALALAALFAAPMASLAQSDELRGMITARDGPNMVVTASDGTQTTVALTDTTRVVSTAGTLGLQQNDLAVTDLINGLPVTVETTNQGGAVEATEVRFKARDLKTARQVEAGTAQVKAQAQAKVSALQAQNAELRQRMTDANEYVEKGQATVLFPSGSTKISSQGKADLQALATKAQSVKGYLIGVVGYADPTGNAEANQALSERRAAAVITYLQKYCNVHPYRVLSPDAMGDAHVVGDVNTQSGLAQNRRVVVKILTNKGLEGL